jgi:RNA-binding protein Musashi
VGGLRDIVTTADLTNYFEKFGTINDYVVMYDRITRKPRGFGFVTFDSQEAVDKVLENRFHDLNGIKVETKMAEPREQSRYQHGYYHGSMSGGYRSRSNYPGMSPHNMSYLFYNGSYFIPAFGYFYPPQTPPNYGYVMDPTSTST